VVLIDSSTQFNSERDIQFSNAIALSSNGNTLAVGTGYQSGNGTGVDADQATLGAINSSAVYTYSRSGAVWSEQAYLKASNTGRDDFFGHPISLSGDGDGETLASGVTKEDGASIGIGSAQNLQTSNDSGAESLYLFRIF